jgi:hypothetical protein
VLRPSRLLKSRYDYVVITRNNESSFYSSPRALALAPTQSRYDYVVITRTTNHRFTSALVLRPSRLPTPDTTTSSSFVTTNHRFTPALVLRPSRLLKSRRLRRRSSSYSSPRAQTLASTLLQDTNTLSSSYSPTHTTSSRLKCLLFSRFTVDYFHCSHNSLFYSASKSSFTNAGGVAGNRRPTH